MPLTRPSTEDDLPAILELTRSNRSLLAELEPDFWTKSANADELHQAFVTFQVTNGNPTNRVLERDGRVIGYAVSSIAVPTELADPPVHVWLPAMARESVTVIGDGGHGYAVMSPAISAPPIYDPGGKPSVIDRVIGADRQSLLFRALSFAQQRGDVGCILVVEAHDTELSDIADRLAARHPVDVFQWPE